MPATFPLLVPITFGLTPPIENLGFEIAGSNAGEAEAWTITATCLAEQAAVWGAEDPPLDEESFDREWTNDDYLYEFDVGDTAPTLLDEDVSEGEAIEDFEEGWDNNHGYLFELGSDEVAQFDSEDAEDFEEEWNDNQDYLFALDSSTAASFDSLLTPQAFEDFEDGWSGTGAGNDYLTELSSSTLAAFDGAAAPENFEDFEEVRTELLTVVDPSTNLFTAGGAHGFSATDRCSFRLLGSGALPAGVNSSFEYFVIASGLATNDFRVSVASGGTQVDVTDAGAGAFVVIHDRTRYWVITL